MLVSPTWGEFLIEGMCDEEEVVDVEVVMPSDALRDPIPGTTPGTAQNSPFAAVIALYVLLTMNAPTTP